MVTEPLPGVADRGTGQDRRGDGVFALGYLGGQLADLREAVARDYDHAVVVAELEIGRASCRERV